LKQGIQNLMCYLGVLKGNFPRTPPPYFRESNEGEEGHLQIGHLSQHRGLFLPEVALWDAVESGQRIGAIYSPERRILQTVHAEQTGRIVVLRTCPSVAPGDFLATVIPM
jgi:predicted deacylase